MEVGTSMRNVNENIGSLHRTYCSLSNSNREAQKDQAGIAPSNEVEKKEK